jgi:hypothetical protein
MDVPPDADDELLPEPEPHAASSVATTATPATAVSCRPGLRIRIIAVVLQWWGVVRTDCR